MIYLSIFFLKISHNYGGSYILKLIKLHTGPLVTVLYILRRGFVNLKQITQSNKFVFSKLIFKPVRFIKIALGTHIEAGCAGSSSFMFPIVLVDWKDRKA